MSKEPIRGTEPINDPYYRYQMTIMDVRKEKTKICITNLDQIAKDLKLPNKDVLVTYIGKKVSAKLRVEKMGKSGSHDRVTMPGNMDLNLVRESIYPFIQTFVLCPTCRLPELSYSIGSKSTLKGTCAACSFYGTLQADKTGDSTQKRFIMILSDLKKNKKKTKEKNNQNLDENSNENPDMKSDHDNPLDMLMQDEMREQSMINNFS